MKKKITSAIIAYIALYAVLCIASLFFIQLDSDIWSNHYRYNYIIHETVIYNIDVAKYYFITLPIAASLPFIIYALLSKMYSKEKHINEEKQIEQVTKSQNLSDQNKANFWGMYLSIKGRLFVNKDPTSRLTYISDSVQKAKQLCLGHMNKEPSVLNNKDDANNFTAYTALLQGAYKALKQEIQELNGLYDD